VPQLLDLGAPVPAWGDRGKLRQVLFNLLSNAYKYSTAPSAVTVRLLRDDGDDEVGGGVARVGLAVTDRGIGMTPEQAARVFERFYRADPSGTVLGTGLGMSIVREIVQLHGGQVALDSQPGEGTTATVWLPRHRWAAGDGAPTLPAAADAALA
jgi:signal transduction histidine kinase